MRQAQITDRIEDAIINPKDTEDYNAITKVMSMTFKQQPDSQEGQSVRQGDIQNFSNKEMAAKIQADIKLYSTKAQSDPKLWMLVRALQKYLLSLQKPMDGAKWSKGSELTNKMHYWHKKVQQDRDALDKAANATVQAGDIYTKCHQVQQTYLHALKEHQEELWLAASKVEEHYEDQIQAPEVADIIKQLDPNFPLINMGSNDQPFLEVGDTAYGLQLKEVKVLQEAQAAFLEAACAKDLLNLTSSIQLGIAPAHVTNNEMKRRRMEPVDPENPTAQNTATSYTPYSLKLADARAAAVVSQGEDKWPVGSAEWLRERPELVKWDQQRQQALKQQGPAASGTNTAPDLSESQAPDKAIEATNAKGNPLGTQEHHRHNEGDGEDIYGSLPPIDEQTAAFFAHGSDSEGEEPKAFYKKRERSDLSSPSPSPEQSNTVRPEHKAYTDQVLKDKALLDDPEYLAIVKTILSDYGILLGTWVAGVKQYGVNSLDESNPGLQRSIKASQQQIAMNAERDPLVSASSASSYRGAATASGNADPNAVVQPSVQPPVQPPLQPVPAGQPLTYGPA